MARRPAALQGDTLQRIRSSAFRLFGRYGHDGVSMWQVAQAANITKAALYWHFDNKESLFLDCQAQLHDIFNFHVLQRMQGSDQPGEQLQDMFYGVVNLLRDPRIRSGVAGYWLSSASLNTGKAIAARRRFDIASISAMAQVMQGALDRGIMRSDISAQDMARAFMAIWEGIILPLRTEPFEVIEQMILTLAKTYFRAHGATALADTMAPLGSHPPHSALRQTA